MQPPWRGKWDRRRRAGRRTLNLEGLRQRLTRKRRCPHCGHRLRIFPAPTACPGCGRQIYPASDRRRRY